MKKTTILFAAAALICSAACSKMKNEISDLKDKVEKLESFGIVIDKAYPSTLETATAGEMHIPYTITGAEGEKVTVTASILTKTNSTSTMAFAMPITENSGSVYIYQGIITEGWDDGFALAREGFTVAIDACTESGRTARQTLNIHESYWWQECLGGSYDSSTQTYTIELDKNAHKDQLGELCHDLYEYYNCGGMNSYGEPEFYCECLKDHKEDCAIDAVISLRYKSGEQFISFTNGEEYVQGDNDYWTRGVVVEYSCEANTSGHMKGEIFEVTGKLYGGAYRVLGYIKFMQNK
ncbi:MAG: hypothetical protein MJZ07_05225 [Bacteroidales bacterium]|nr:hypothetical protein [Bacteroidales bacterium]